MGELKSRVTRKDFQKSYQFWNSYKILAPYYHRYVKFASCEKISDAGQIHVLTRYFLERRYFQCSTVSNVWPQAPARPIWQLLFTWLLAIIKRAIWCWVAVRENGEAATEAIPTTFCQIWKSYIKMVLCDMLKDKLAWVSSRSKLFAVAHAMVT